MLLHHRRSCIFLYRFYSQERIYWRGCRASVSTLFRPGRPERCFPGNGMNGTVKGTAWNFPVPRLCPIINVTIDLNPKDVDERETDVDHLRFPTVCSCFTPLIRRGLSLEKCPLPQRHYVENHVTKAFGSQRSVSVLYIWKMIGSGMGDDEPWNHWRLGPFESVMYLTSC